MERLMEWWLELIAKLHRDPYAIWPAFIGAVIALFLMIFPGILKNRVTSATGGTLRRYAELGDVFNILWMGSAAVGLILLCKGIAITCARLEKAGRIPD